VNEFSKLLSQLYNQRAWLKYALEILFIVVAAGVIRSITVRLLRRWTSRSDWKQKHFLLALLERVITPILVLAGIAACLNLFPLSDKLLKVLNRGFYIAVLIVGLYCAANAGMMLLNRWLDARENRAHLREPVQFASRLVFGAFGTMIVLENLGVSLTAVWTTLGVGSVALALALQDTLSNFFAGVYLRIDNPIGLGDYIKLESGEEGYVVQRGWRSTRMKALGNNTIVVPNSKLASTIVTNFSLPDPRMGISIHVSVNLNSDPQRVETLLVEEASKALGSVPGMLSEPAPSAQFIPGFGQFSLDFSVNCTVATYVDQYGVQAELRKRIYKRLRAEGIDFPVAPREVHLSSIPSNDRHPADHHAASRH
jgi:small-conductance mechanosensitive channel